MNNIVIFSVVYIFSVFISSVSQIMLKKSALKEYDSKLKEYMNPLVIFAYGLFFLSSLITVLSLKYVPLSYGPILESTGYIFINVLSLLFLKEKISRRKYIGMAVIILGIAICSISI